MLKWILIVGGALVVIALVGVIVVVLSAIEESEEKAAQVKPAEFRALQEGTSKGDVRAVLGEPEDTSPKTVKGIGNLRCWYYGTLAERTYEVCFQGGGLAFKVRL